MNINPTPKTGTEMARLLCDTIWQDIGGMASDDTMPEPTADIVAACDAILASGWTPDTHVAASIQREGTSWEWLALADGSSEEHGHNEAEVCYGLTNAQATALSRALDAWCEPIYNGDDQ